MDLRSGCPYWLLRGDRFPPYPQLEHDAQCDVAIIGGGITGALVAHYLANAGISAVLVDRRQPGCGSTMASTGLPCIGSHPSFPHGIFALGYGGNGITFSLIAAEIIRDQLSGRANADAKIFRFERHPL